MTVKIFWELQFFDDEKEIDMKTITEEDFQNLKRIVVQKVIEEFEIMRKTGKIISGSTLENAKQV